VNILNMMIRMLILIIIIYRIGEEQNNGIVVRKITFCVFTLVLNQKLLHAIGKRPSDRRSRNYYSRVPVRKLNILIGSCQHALIIGP